MTYQDMAAFAPILNTVLILLGGMMALVQLKVTLNLFVRQLNNIEDRLSKFGDRLEQHGERIAALEGSK